MVPRMRLSAEERRQSILQAAIPLFAAKGFKGTTTKMIAKAADVSEALLYRHFPSKESMYLELRDFVCDQKDEVLGFMSSMPANTHTLIFFFHFLIHHIFLGEGKEGHSPEFTQDQLCRLMANSFLEDGAFARLFLDDTIALWQPFLLRCVEASSEAGDMQDPTIPPLQKLWFGHHLAVALNLLHLPSEQVIDYGAQSEVVARNAVHFVLRGLGIKEEVINQYYQPETFPKWVS